MNNLLSKFLNKKRISHKIKRTDPYKNWITLLKVLLTAIFILIVFSLYLLLEIKKDQMFKIETDPANLPSVLDENLLDKITKKFKQREVISESIKLNEELYVDPSK